MKILNFVNGPFSVNTYILDNDVNAVIIDPGHDISEAASYLVKKSLKLSHILVTHGHIDHVAGINAIKKIFPDAVSMLNPNDSYLIEQSSAQSMLFGLQDPGEIIIDMELPESGSFYAGEFKVELIHVPGHSKGSVCLKFGKNVFTGDTLFAGAVGRSDLPGGNHQQLIQMIKNRLFVLENDTVIYPGHGPDTTIEIEKRNNPFFQF